MTAQANEPQQETRPLRCRYCSKPYNDADNVTPCNCPEETPVLVEGDWWCAHEHQGAGGVVMSCNHQDDDRCGPIMDGAFADYSILGGR